VQDSRGPDQPKWLVPVLCPEGRVNAGKCVAPSMSADLQPHNRQAVQEYAVFSDSLREPPKFASTTRGRAQGVAADAPAGLGSTPALGFELTADACDCRREIPEFYLALRRLRR
jgi:hypothetical protein